jgi:hypothetical protein
MQRDVGNGRERRLLYEVMCPAGRFSCMSKRYGQHDRAIVASGTYGVYSSPSFNRRQNE